MSQTIEGDEAHQMLKRRYEALRAQYMQLLIHGEKENSVVTVESLQQMFKQMRVRVPMTPNFPMTPVSSESEDM